MTGSMGHTGAKEIFCFLGVDSFSEKLSTPKNKMGRAPLFHLFTWNAGAKCLWAGRSQPTLARRQSSSLAAHMFVCC